MENFPAGNYIVGYVAVEALTQLAGVNNVDDLSGCFSLSNQLLVTTFPVNGGTITANAPISGCVGNVSFSVTGQQGNIFRWALLNSNATQVIAQNSTGIFDFTSLPNGTYRVVHVASRGVNLGTVVPPVLPACVAASNQIVVNKNCILGIITSDPNPSTGTSWVTFQVTEESLSTLEVYDMSGRMIAELFRQVAESDTEYRLQFDGNSLPNGVYIYRLTTGDNVLVEKFIIAR